MSEIQLRTTLRSNWLRNDFWHLLIWLLITQKCHSSRSKLLTSLLNVIWKESLSHDIMGVHTECTASDRLGQSCSPWGVHEAEGRVWIRGWVGGWKQEGLDGVKQAGCCCCCCCSTPTPCHWRPRAQEREEHVHRGLKSSSEPGSEPIGRRHSAVMNSCQVWGKRTGLLVDYHTTSFIHKWWTPPHFQDFTFLCMTSITWTQTCQCVWVFQCVLYTFMASKCVYLSKHVTFCRWYTISFKGFRRQNNLTYFSNFSHDEPLESLRLCLTWMRNTFTESARVQWSTQIKGFHSAWRICLAQ